ncbi:MAG TPA: CocE/NonD family hydrolase [Acidimicrobiales bacterium]|nr:CocE/NonD family hydrolase [Acidimicrobiales bacterium]
MPSRARRLAAYVATFTVASAGAAYAAAPVPGAPSGGGSGSALAPELPASVMAASFAPGSTWKPEPATYGTTSTDDVPVTMSDGTVLRVDVVYPTDPRTGRPAAGPFPVLLTQTPYGKGSGGSSTAGSQQPGGGAATGGADNYLAQRGYIEVIADVRGTGDSEGTWGLFDPVQTSDGITLVRWAARLPHSSGKVGTYGPSYLGINQLLLAGAIGKGSPLKAIFPMVAANDIYRDTSFMGGLIDSEFGETYLGLTAALNMVNPIGDALRNPPQSAPAAGELATVEAQHAGGIASYHAAFSAETLSGGPTAFDGNYWQDRAPSRVLANIVANGIPAYLVGGEFDIFQRGEPLNYAGLQNAWANRPTGAPMEPGQAVTGRYQLVDGPWEHLNGSSVDVDQLELAWFDQWLKGDNTGIGSTPTPLHYYDIGTGTWDETTTYPFTGSTVQRLYLGNGTLSTARPGPSSSGTSRLVWTGAGSPCSRPVDQWSMGALSIASQSAEVTAPCAANDRPSADNPLSSVTFTSAPLQRPERIAGPLAATLYASATTKDTEWAVEVEDVAPDGTSTPLTEGALLGSLRAVDPASSWPAPGGGFLLPYHPYTEDSARPVTPGSTTRYDIEIFPTFATIKAGHSIRVTVSTADSPHLSPTIPEAANLAGGVYTLDHTAQNPSWVDLAVQPGA